MLTDTQTTIDVKYTNQPMSFHTCGNSGHRAWRCRTQQSDFINKVKLESNDSIESELSEIEIDNDIDIHIDASQNTNRFECNDCNFVCSYLDTMNDHKVTHIGKNILKCCECESQITTQLHTGESPSKCDNCAGKDSNDRALKDHILPHNVEKPSSGAECEFICKQCQYICNNEDVLINHLKTHNKYLCNI